MHRQPLLDLIQRYDARFPEETETVTRFREFVEENPECFERELEIGHITGAAWLIDAAGEQVLLTHHRKLDIWIQLGGHADGDPDTLNVAMREAEEESGLDQIIPIDREIFDLDIHPIPARKNEPGHLHFDVRFALQHQGEGNYAVSDESHDLAWVPIQEIGKFTEEASIQRMTRKWLSRGA
tara:strand:- start:5879 stop:6424 length:546 start_codon:yes stop_codon:yes gene_type:complete